MVRNIFYRHGYLVNFVTPTRNRTGTMSRPINIIGQTVLQKLTVAQPLE
jgi:hypothetical protein